MTDQPKIEIEEHGPYRVTGVAPLLRAAQVETEYGEDDEMLLQIDIHDDVLEFYANVKAEIGPYASEAGSADGGDGGGDKTVNGVMVPALLLDRSKRARERLSAA